MLRRADQSGFAITFVVVLLLIGIAGVGLYLRIAHHDSPSLGGRPGSPTSSRHVITVSGESQTVTVDQNTEVKLPTGATIDLRYFTFNPATHDTESTLTNKIEREAFSLVQRAGEG